MINWELKMESEINYHQFSFPAALWLQLWEPGSRRDMKTVTDRGERGGGVIEIIARHSIFKMMAERSFLQELGIASRPFIKKKLEVNIISESGDILSLVPRIYGFSMILEQNQWFSRQIPSVIT